MNNMYGLGTYGANSFVDTFFGTSSTRGGSLLSSIGDLQKSDESLCGKTEEQ